MPLKKNSTVSSVNPVYSVNAQFLPNYSSPSLSLQNVRNVRNQQVYVEQTPQTHTVAEKKGEHVNKMKS